MIQLKPIALTAENFKDYGKVIGKGYGQPVADNEEFTYWSRVSELKLSELTSTGVLVSKKRVPAISKMERHVRTPELLAALEGESLLCVAKPSMGSSNEIEGIQTFLIHQGGTFVMNPGTWHWVPVPVNCEACKFLVVFALGTEENDLEIKVLDEKIKIEI